MIVENGGRFGDLKKFIVKINGTDITTTVLSCHIFTSITQYFWSAELFISDTTNIVMRLPILAGDIVTIQLETELDSVTDDSKIFRFILQSRPFTQNPNHHQKSYLLNLVDERAILNQTIRIAQSFNETQSSIIRRIVSENLNATCLIPYRSENNIQCIIPNWSPMTAIAWLSKSAINNRTADYLFYQSDTNEYSFKPFEKMFSSNTESSNVTFSMKPTYVRELDKDVYDFNMNITKIEMTHYDILQNSNTGLYASKTVSYDFTDKEWKTYDFKFGDDNRQDYNLRPDQNPLLDSTGLSSMTFSPHWDKMTATDQSIHDNAQNWIGSRKSSISKLDQEKLAIQTTGGVGCWKWLGKNCKVDLPSQQDWIESVEFDKFYRGTYVIASITHMIDKIEGSYMVNYELIKKRLDAKMKHGDMMK